MDHLYYNSPVILTFFFISLGVLIFNAISKNTLNMLLFSTYRSSIISPLTYVRMVTHIFGHQGWSHFMNNFLTILLIGPMMEEKYGSINLLYMIGITAIVTGLLHNIFSRNRLLGASGIVYMMIALSSFVNIEAGKVPITLILIFIFYIVNEVISSFLKLDNVSHIGHLIGAICGIAFGFYFS